MRCVAAHAGWRLALFFVGKLAITFAFNGLYVFTAELFPTRARSSALAACSLVGRLGSVAAPMTPLLVRRILHCNTKTYTSDMRSHQP